MQLLQLQVRLALEHREELALLLSRVVEEEAFHLRLAEEAPEEELVQREVVLPPVALPSEEGGPGCFVAGVVWLKLGGRLPPAAQV